MVSIDTNEAFCEESVCTYLYVESVGTITQQAYTAGKNTITVTGTQLPIGDDVTASFGGFDCVPTSKTATKIVCELAEEVIAGDWSVQIGSTLGQIPFADEVASLEFLPTITSAKSLDNDGSINVLGGSTVVLSGSFFGSDSSIVSVVLEDGTYCTIIGVEPDSLYCSLPELASLQEIYDALASEEEAGVTLKTTMQLTLTVNGKSVETEIKLSTEPVQFASVVPENALPMIDTELTLTLDYKLGL